MSKEDPGLAAVRRAGHSRKTTRAYRRKYKKGCAKIFFIALVLPVVTAASLLLAFR